MKSSIHEAATAFDSISLFAFTAFPEVPEFCILKLENLSLELPSQLWDSKRPGKTEKADWAVSQSQTQFFWFQKWSWSAPEICAWRAERRSCLQMLSDTAPSLESLINFSACYSWQNFRSWSSGTTFSRTELQRFCWVQSMKYFWGI